MPRRRRSSWGCVTKLGPGRFRLRWPEWDGTTRVRRTKVMRCTRREADAELARLRVRLELPPDERPCPTFAEVWDGWYVPESRDRLADGSLSKRTLDLYGRLWSNHVSPRWSDVPMSDVEPQDYQAWLLTLTASVGRLANVLVGNLVACARRHGVRGVEFRDVSYRLSKRSEVSHTDGVYRYEEMDALCRAARGRACEIPAILAGFGSCRVGEACAPRVKDVSEWRTAHGRVALVRIDAQLTQRDGVHARLKNEQSRRTVVIPEPWASRVLEVAAEHGAEGLLWLNDDGCGEPCNRDCVASAWREVVRSCGLQYLPLSKLRNSWETMCRWMLHIDKDLIDKMMGHTSADVRAKHYDRPDEEMFAETVADAWFRFGEEKR